MSEDRQVSLWFERVSSDDAPTVGGRNAAPEQMIHERIERAGGRDAVVGIGGQPPGDPPGFARFLPDAGIDSFQVNPDRVWEATRTVAETEERGNW